MTEISEAALNRIRSTCSSSFSRLYSCHGRGNNTRAKGEHIKLVLTLIWKGLWHHVHETLRWNVGAHTRHGVQSSNACGSHNGRSLVASKKLVHKSFYEVDWVKASTLHKFLKIFIIHVFKFTDESLSSIQEEHRNIDITQFCGDLVVVGHCVKWTEISNNGFGFEICTNFLLDIGKSIFDSFLVATNNANVEALLGKLDTEFFSHSTVTSSNYNIWVFFTVVFKVVKSFA